MKIKEMKFEEVEKGICSFCLSKKECIKIKGKIEVYSGVIKEIDLNICETCVSKMFRLFRKEV